VAAPFDFDLLCLGSGPAGQRAAVQAAKLGKRAAVVEKARSLGGVCVDTGTIPSKTFREAVRSFSRTDRWGTVYGVPSAARPTADQLLSRVHAVVRQECEIIEAQLRRNDVGMYWGRGRFLDPHTIEIDADRGSQVVTAEKILIAVGTHAAPPPGGSDPRVVVTSDAILGLKQLPKTLAVVGAGVIGMEYASMFASLGIPTTVVERREKPLEFLDEEILVELMHQMRNSNVTFRMGEAVASVEVVPNGTASRAALTLESGKRIVADLVLYSAGRVGATDGLGLEKVGLAPDARGRLSVNERFETAVPHIYAAGDVIGFPSLAATSSEQGRRAACHAFGVDVCAFDTVFPYGIYSIPEISMVGETESALTSRRIPYELGIARYREIARGKILGDDTGLVKLLFHRETRALLGVHAIGSGATELIHIGQAVLALGGGLDYFLRAVFNYPTLAECYKVAALDAANRLSR